jgi:hypothetical protein
LLQLDMEPVEDGIDFERVLYKTCRQYEALREVAVRALVESLDAWTCLLDVALMQGDGKALRRCYGRAQRVRRSAETEICALRPRPEQLVKLQQALRELVAAELEAAMMLDRANNRVSSCSQRKLQAMGRSFVPAPPEPSPELSD